MGAFRTITALLKNEGGNALFIASLAMPVLIGAGGLATDTIQWTLWKRQIQRQADSAALAGAFALTQGKSATSAATTEINRHSFVTLLGSPTIENAPTTGTYSGNSSAVRVVLQTRQSLPFSSFFLSTPPTISAEATAAVIQDGNPCALALVSNTDVGITLTGSAVVNLGCDIATNSRAPNAVDPGGSSEIYTPRVSAMGGLQSSSNYKGSTVLQPYSLQQADPFASLPKKPTLPSDCSKNGKLNDKPKDITPIDNPTGAKCYTDMNIQGEVAFAPGVYYIDGGSFKVNSGAKITGTNVTFILTSSTADTNPTSIGTIDINGGATVQLTSPTSDTYKGVLFYQDSRAQTKTNGAKNTNFINGNASSSLDGAIYIPSQEVSFSGSSDMKTKCVQIVGWTITFTGNSKIENECTGSGANSFRGTRVLLVG